MKNHTIFQTFIKYVSFNVLSMIGLSCYILADTFFIANKLGADGLTALNLAIPIYSFINGTGLMIGIGGATKFAILKAQGEHKKADTIFTHSVLFGTVFGLLYLLAGILLSERLTLWMGADMDTFAMANNYLKTILCFSPFFILNNILISFIRNDNEPRLARAAMLAGSFSNIILDYFFVYPLRMGMFGAAFATCLAPVISMTLLSRHFIKKRHHFHITRCLPKLDLFKTISSLGLAALITELSSGIVIIIFNIVILKISGNTGVAAYGIVANLALVATSVFTGIAQGIQPILSHHHGLGNQESIRKLLRYALILSITLATMIYGMIFFFSKPLIQIFNSGNDLTLESIASKGLSIYFVGFFFAGINIVSSSYFMSIEKPYSAFILSFLRGFLILIPAVIILSEVFKMKGIWASYPFAEIFTTAIAVLLFYSAAVNSSRSEVQ